jgi:hypothetical protein
MPAINVPGTYHLTRFQAHRKRGRFEGLRARTSLSAPSFHLGFPFLVVGGPLWDSSGF